MPVSYSTRHLFTVCTSAARKFSLLSDSAYFQDLAAQLLEQPQDGLHVTHEQSDAADAADIRSKRRPEQKWSGALTNSVANFTASSKDCCRLLSWKNLLGSVGSLHRTHESCLKQRHQRSSCFDALDQTGKSAV
jgi:hypothetical protein